MNTLQTWQTESYNPDDTFVVGEQLGRSCMGGELFLLTSDLGGGKTTLVKGLAKGLGSTMTVNSPTFTVERIYDCRDGISIHHFDFYRLQNAGILQFELHELLDDPKVIIVIEWGDIVGDTLPLQYVELRLTRQAADENSRIITANFTNDLAYLFKDIS